MHSKYGLEEERLYNFWPSKSQNRGAFFRTLSTSAYPSSKISFLRNCTIESIQLSPTLIWWIWTISLLILVGLHKSSTRITWSKLYTEEVARVVRESACVFLLLRICSKVASTWLDSNTFAFSHPWPPTFPLPSLQLTLNLKISPLFFLQFSEL